MDTPSLPPSALVVALDAWRSAPTKERRDACLSALATAVVYLCAPPPGLDRTGREPLFRLVTAEGHTLLAVEGEGVGPALWVFADRASAEAFCRRAAGWLPEPVPGPVAAHLAARAGLLLIVDPIGAALVIDGPMLAWAICPRRPAARPPFAEAYATWRSDQRPWTQAPLAAALADAAFWVIEAEVSPGPDDRVPMANVAGRLLVLEVLEGVLYLSASTDRATVVSWCEGTRCRPMALDGSMLLALGSGLRVDVGLMIGAARALAIGPDEPEWPRRELSASDF